MICTASKMAKFVLFLLFSVVSAQTIDENICTKCSCDSNGYVLNINCNNLGLEEIFKSWPTINGTDTISISYNGNNLIHLERFPSTNATIQLILSNCNIEYLDAGLFQSIINIKYVDLSHNKITAEELSSAKFQGPYNETKYEPLSIEHLDLSYNEIHSIGKNVFEHLISLKTLNLEGNQFRVLDLPTQLAISSLTSLERLNLANNQLTELVDNAITTLTKLYALDLSNNLIDFVPESLIHIGNTLQVLILDGNPIFELVDDTFIGLNNLTELYLNNLTRLRYVNGNTFAPLTNLQKLHLCNNPQLTDIDREAFRPNFTLRELYLTNNNLYKIDYNLLYWPSLQVFNFTNNPLDCSCDLYNITTVLNWEITRVENGPYCYNPNTDKAQPVFYLKSDICKLKKRTILTKNLRGYNHLSIAMTGLILVVVFASALAMHMGFLRYKIFRQNRTSFNSNIVYNPVQG